MTTSALTVANTIASQIGARAFYMMGTRHKLGDANSLTFDIRGCREINKVRVVLDPSDTYTVDFWKVPGPAGFIRGDAPKVVKSLEGVYEDMLHAIIEETTGLRLSL